MEEESVNYCEKYSGVYITTTANEITIPITLNNTTYRSDLDILDVHINGLKLGDNEFNIDGSNIQLAYSLDIGAEVYFEAFRSVVTTLPFSSLKGDKGDVGSTTTIKRWEVT